ncbi:hypothetical protein ACJDU8_05330 [Clostridium sp. WILCCON 0269]|uniref:UspA domain-containing protein n=1 Tax=Candidatus Clostridium eludens TaxID=3381663 RepID=A0ABW8SGJ7_9CLOT
MQENIVLVCVSDQVDGEKLIKEGWRIAEKENFKIKVLNIQNNNQSKNLKGTSLEYLFNICKFLKIDMQVYWGNNFSDILINYIQRNKINQLVLGKITKSEQTNLISEVQEAFPDILVFIIE